MSYEIIQALINCYITLKLVKLIIVEIKKIYKEVREGL